MIFRDTSIYISVLVPVRGCSVSVQQYLSNSILYSVQMGGKKMYDTVFFISHKFDPGILIAVQTDAIA